MEDISFLKNCKTLNDVSRILFGKANYNCREKVKIFLHENNIDWHEWLEQKKTQNKQYCKVCGKELNGQQKFFCSHSCSAKANNVLRGEKKYCKNCGKVLKEYQNNFCSHDCDQEFRYKEYIVRWKNGEENGINGKYGFSNHLRRYFFEKYDCKCQKCGWREVNETTGKVPLQIHHIDGDYKNNKEENIQLLCPNCHSLTETFGSLNKNGRKDRKPYNDKKYWG